MVVVIFIGIVIILSLLPVAIGLLRQQRALAAPTLGVESVPLLWERLRADFSLAATSLVEQPGSGKAFRIVLPPRKREDPEVVWHFQGKRVARVAEWADEDGEITTTTRTWTLTGEIAVDRDQLVFGRTVLLYSLPKTPDEYLAFVSGRPTVRK